MIFDGHSDIFTDVTIKRLLGETQVIEQYHLPRLRQGNIEGGCFVIWIDPPYDKNPPKRLEQIMHAIREEMQDCKGAVTIRNLAEIEEAKKNGKFYILMAMEGLSGIGKNVDKLYELHDFGIRCAALTWNEENDLATGVNGTPERGLTTLGKQAIQIIQEKKMILDVSHLNEKSFWDVIDVAQTPILASHSNAKALVPAKRNLTDAQLLAIRDSKGLVGLNSFNLFVGNTPQEHTVDNLVHHASYIAEKIGVDHLSFGFDFFEFLDSDSTKDFSTETVPYTVGLEDCSKAPLMLEKMKKAGFSDKELLQISHQNWHNLIQKVIG